MRLLRGKVAAEPTSTDHDQTRAGLLLDKGRCIEPASTNDEGIPSPPSPTAAEGGPLAEGTGPLRRSEGEGRQAVLRLLVDKGVGAKLVEENNGQRKTSPSAAASLNNGEAALRLSFDGGAS